MDRMDHIFTPILIWRFPKIQELSSGYISFKLMSIFTQAIHTISLALMSILIIKVILLTYVFWQDDNFLDMVALNI